MNTTEWIHDQLNKAPNANDNILGFIRAVAVTEPGAIKLFSKGYCYYFALMLNDAFPGGQICWAAPHDHIVYLYDSVPYDIDGICDKECSFLPVDMLGDVLECYRHRGADGELNYQIMNMATTRGMNIDDFIDWAYDQLPAEAKNIPGVPQERITKESVVALHFREIKALY